MEQLYTSLISAAITIIGAASAFLVSFLKTRTLKKRLQSLEDFIASDETEYYIECPTCKSKILLNKVKILINK